MWMFAAAAVVGLAFSALSASPATAQTSPPATPFLAEQIFTPVYPCRVFDTRTTSRIPTGSARTFFIAGRENYAGQGGATNGCGVPLWATAVSISLSATSPSAAGALTPYAFGGSRPNVTAVSYQPGDAAATAGTTAAIRNGKLTIYASQATHVIGDVTGYFAPPIRATIFGGYNLGPPFNTHFIRSTPRFVSVSRVDVGKVVVTIDRDVSSCEAFAQSVTLVANQAVTSNLQISGNQVTIQINVVRAGTVTAADGWTFGLHVSC